MKWSKVRKLVEDSFAPSVRGRVTMVVSRRGACSCGYGWIVVDGTRLAVFDGLVSYARYGSFYHETTESPYAYGGHRAITDQERTVGQLVEPGEFSRQDLFAACWSYLHSSLNDSIASPNPLIQSLAVLDARVGKHRLRRVAMTHLHPLTRALLEFRMEADAALSSPLQTAQVSA